jgi:microcystin-dependent protein
VTANTIPQAVPATVIPAAHHNAVRTAMNADLVPRENGVPTANAGSVGTEELTWLKVFTEAIKLGAAGTNFEINQDESGNIIFTIDDEEKFRIPITGSAIPVGMIAPMATSFVPDGWLVCNGAAVSRTTYARLFEYLGESHGEGNGTTTFNVPNYQGLFLRMVANGSSNDPDRASRSPMATGGASGDAIGSVQSDAIKEHTHEAPSPTNEPFFTGTLGSEININTEVGATNIKAKAATETAGPAGAAVAETRPKNAYVNYIIKV